MKETTSNKLKRVLVLFLALTMTVGGLTGCGPKKEISNYQGELKEGETVSDFNKELFYRNEKQDNFADPFVLDNIERDGYYYLYGTQGFMFCYRSKDLMDWEPVGHCLSEWHYDSEGATPEQLKLIAKDLWAPEVIYDEDTKKYYMYFSASPQADDSVQGIEEGNARFVMMVATSDYPDRDFKIVNFQDAASCGEENLRKLDTKAYPQYYAKYALFDPTEHTAFARKNGLKTVGLAGYTYSIDPHPYVDEDGTKYLIWRVNGEGLCSLVGAKMNNWLSPDWSTATVLTYSHYYTVEDYHTAMAGGSVDSVTYEETDVNCNEGPYIIKHNGKYYMTFSVNEYVDSDYQVGQAVADSVLGPYRKLTEEEGGLLISGGVAGSLENSGTGHHSFVTIGEQMYMVYHIHNDPVVGGGPRHHVIDEMKWITIKDKDGNDLEVMYTNGPTCTVQPKIEAYSEYKNIADEAKVSGTEDATYLTDGLLSIYKYGNPTFMEYIKETTITEKTTFTFDFDTARTVRAIMVYNSKLEISSFEKVAKVEFVCEENGKEVTYCINDIIFSAENYKANELDGSMYYIIPGAASYAEFNELNCTSVRVTIEVPEGQESVGISEIRILGK